MSPSTPPSPEKTPFHATLSQNPEWQKAIRGELYHAFVPELIAARERCAALCDEFNTTRDLSRWNVVRLWREITCDPTPLPPRPAPTSSTDPFADDPIPTPPTHIDYGPNVHLGPGVFLNYNSTFIDTCAITIGARTLIGPNCSFYSGTHPLDPAVRNGTLGPEGGKEVHIGEDCWLGGNVIVLPGVRIGRGVTVGAGSVVTKDVPPFHVVAGNPARIIRKIVTAMDTSETGTETTGT